MGNPLAARILAHRGHWNDESGYERLPKNSLGAMLRAVELGFGIETDLRDFHGEIVISHDPALNADFGFDKFARLEIPGLVALNIKADGLATLIKSIIDLDKPEFEYFCFDMSMPETQRYIQVNLPVAKRVSELENLSSLRSGYMWLDSFETDWYRREIEWLSALKSEKVVVVSPELHNRPHTPSWKWLVARMNEHANLYICTDYPLEFLKYWEDSH